MNHKQKGGLMHLTSNLENLIKVKFRKNSPGFFISSLNCGSFVYLLTHGPAISLNLLSLSPWQLDNCTQDAVPDTAQTTLKDSTLTQLLFHDCRAF